MSWNVKYSVLIFFTTITSYFAGEVIDRCKHRGVRKAVLYGTIVLNLSLLVLFKYFNFLCDAVYGVLGILQWNTEKRPVLDLLLPVGISFYTFQTMSYVIDIYRGEKVREKHFGYYAAFVSFFPQLVAGPIERASRLLPQIKSEKRFSYKDVSYGMKLMAVGYFKKMAVADVLGIHVDRVYAELNLCHGMDIIFAILFFSIQIYCDFSGYTDIARGSAKMLGIDLTENFKNPYSSLSIKEFWRRWHISLSTWFRDYVYIPLGGNKRSKIRNAVNVIITFLLSGFWHGANWTFILWGAIHGTGQVLETAVTRKEKTNTPVNRFVRWLFVFAFVNVAWVFFRADSLREAIDLFSCLISTFSDPAIFFGSSMGLSIKRLLLISVLLGILAFYDHMSSRGDVIQNISKYNFVVRWSIYILFVVFVFFVYTIYAASSESFVYFQF